MDTKAKYYSLYKYLNRRKASIIKISRKEIEKIVGFSLPKSSKLNTWWTNNPENGHCHAYAWVKAGYSARANGDFVSFVK